MTFIKMIMFNLFGTEEIKTRGVGDYPSTSIINLKIINYELIN